MLRCPFFGSVTLAILQGVQTLLFFKVDTLQYHVDVCESLCLSCFLLYWDWSLLECLDNQVVIYMHVMFRDFKKDCQVFMTKECLKKL